jgi:hypothetical protein
LLALSRRFGSNGTSTRASDRSAHAASHPT